MTDLESGRRRVWGPWATIGFTLFIVVVQFIVQTLFAGVYVVAFGYGSRPAQWIQAAGDLSSDGLFLGLAMLVSSPIAIGLMTVFIWLRRGPRLRDYLALRSAGWRVTLKWLGYTLLLMFALALVSYAFGKEQSLEWMVRIYRETTFVPVLIAALVVAAPLVEELVFRGFLYEGLTHTRIGPAGAILVGSFAWSCLHVQYDLFFIGQVFVLGLLFGAARYRTGSLWVPIAMHALNNGVAVWMLAVEAAAG